MRAFTPRAESFFTSRSASTRVLYAASWMVQLPRATLAFGALLTSVVCRGFTGVLAGAVASARGVGTSVLDGRRSVSFSGAEALVVALALPVVLGPVVDVGAPADCTAAPRDAPAVVTLAAAGGVTVVVAVEQ